MPPTRKQCNAGPIPRDQRFFFGSRPAFDLALSGNRVGDLIEMLREYQTNWPARGRITAELAFVMLSDTPLEIGTRRTHVETPVGTTENV